MTADERTAEQDSGYARRWPALAVCMAGGVMVFLDVSIVNVALPAFEQGLGATSTDLSWIVAGYALTFGLLLVPGGRLGDGRGRRRMFVIGLVAFAAASVLAGLAWSAPVLVVARLLQGAAGGLLNPQLLGLIRQMFPAHEQGTAFGVFGAVNATATAVGPVVGGLLLEAAGPDVGWRLVFLVNLPFAVVALVLARRLMPPDRPATERSISLDPVGALLLGVTVVAVMVPLVLSQHGGAGAAPWWTLAIAAVGGLAFWRWERRYARRGNEPILTTRVLRSPGYSLGTTVGSLYLAGSTAIFFVLTVYLQQGQGYSPLQAGLVTLPYAVGSAVAAAIGGRMVGRVGRPLVVVGCVVMILGLIGTDLALRSLTGAAAGLAAVGPLLVAGLGSGMVITPNQALTLADVPVDEGGTAAGMQQTAQRVGSAIGIALVAGVFFGALAGGGYGAAIGTGLLVSIGFVAAALVVGIADLVHRRRRA